MNDLGTLYYYELKKLWKRKIVWVTLLVGLLVVVVIMAGNLMGSYDVGNEKRESNYQAYLTDREYQRKLDGREVDQSLLKEMSDAYHRVPLTAERYSTTEEYQIYARPYSAIFNFVGDMTQMTTAETIQWKPDINDFYAKRRAMLEEQWLSGNLSAGEKEYWRQKESEIKTPFVYQRAESCFMLLRAVTTIGLFVLMSVAICLPGVFAEEHTRRTNQLILCSKYGKDRAYWAKILAGLSFAAGVSLVLTAVAVGLAVGIYGAEGFDAMVQLIFAEYSYPLTAGQAVLILYGCVIVTAVCFSTFVMLLSEVFHSSIATLAIAFGTLILSMICSFPVSPHYRVLSQIWNCLPSGFLTPWNIFDVRLISVFGQYLTAWQAVPVIYAIAGAGIAAVGKLVYRHFQVAGR